MQIILSGGPLGAEVAGIDMRHPLDAGEVAELKQAGTIISYWSCAVSSTSLSTTI